MKRYAYVGILAAVALFVGLLFVLPIAAQATTTVFTNLRVTNSATVVNDLTVADDANIRDLNVTTSMWTRRATTVTVTGGAFSLTPGGAYQPISAAATTGFGAISGCDATNEGRRLQIVDGANQTITITDTGTLKMAGNFAMGQYDAISFVCDSVNWIETARANN